MIPEAMANTHLMQTYSRLDVSFEYGKGVWLWDTHGKRYLDALSGIAVCALGHAHPNISAAVRRQSERLTHVSNLYEIPEQTRLATKLATLTGLQSAFFSNSGAEANEAAVKLVRRQAHAEGNKAPVIVTMAGGFHGRTLGMLAANHTGAQFAPLPAGFIQVPFDDIQALERAIQATPNICAVMLEPIQGEGGVRISSKEYMQAVRRLCDTHHLWLILDEVQTGVGRTGAWYCYQHHQILPDVLTSAKALGNGIPIGVCMAGESLAKTFTPGEHGSTFGGNPLACAVAMAVLDTIESDGLCRHATQMGDYIVRGLQATIGDERGVSAIRGKGLMIGIELQQECKVLAQRALERGLLINIASGKMIRLLPPLIIETAEADLLINTLSGLVLEFLRE